MKTMMATCAALAAMLTFGVRAETTWGLVDAVYGCNSATVPAQDRAAMWPFRSDEGGLEGSVGNPICGYATGVSRKAEDWAPQQVYGCERYVNPQNKNTFVQFCFANLRPNATYRLDYLAAETYFGSEGSRLNAMEVNGKKVMEGLDLVKESGGRGKAVTKSYEVMSDADGKIAVKMVYGGVNNSKYAGLAVFGTELPSELKLAYDEETDTVTYSACDALTYEIQTASSVDGPWRKMIYELSDGGAEHNFSGKGDRFFRLVAANGVGSATSEVLQAKARAYCLIDAVYAGEPTALTAEEQSLVWPFRSDAGMSSTTPAGATVQCAKYFNDSLTRGTGDWAHPYVYKTERFSLNQSAGQTLDVTFDGLTPGANYRVEYFGAEYYHGSAGVRKFTVAVNGMNVDQGLDLFAEKGKNHSAVTKMYEATADETGRIVVSLGRIADCPKYGGLALYGMAGPSDAAIAYDDGSDTFTVSAHEALTCTLQRSMDGEHWEDVATVRSGSGKDAVIPAVPGKYFRAKAENDLGVAFSEVIEVSPTVTASDKLIYAWNVGPEDEPFGRFAALGALDLGGVYPQCAFSSAALVESFGAKLPRAVAASGFVQPSTPFKFEFPGLTPEKTYLVRKYKAASATSGAVDEVAVTADADGKCVLTPAQNETVCAIELIEQGATDLNPAAGVVQAVSFSGGVAIVPVLQRADTTFEVRKGDVTVATDVKRIWVDTEGTVSDRYQVRAVSGAGVPGNWSSALVSSAVASGEFLGVASTLGAGETLTDGSRVWQSVLDHRATGSPNYSSTDINGDFSLLRDAPPSSLLKKGFWLNNKTDGIRLSLRGLIPGMGYRFRLITCDTYAGSSKLGGRVMNMTVNGRPLAQNVDLYKARGSGGWAALECRAVASQQGTVYLNITSTVENPQILTAEVSLEGVGELTGGRVYAQGKETVLDGVLNLPDSDAYAFDADAVSTGVLHIDDKLVTGRVFLGAGAHRLRFRHAEASAVESLAFSSSHVKNANVRTYLASAPVVPYANADWVLKGPGDLYAAAIAGEDTIWKVMCEGGEFRFAFPGRAVSGEVSFRIRDVRDVNEHGLSLGAFFGGTSLAAIATDQGVTLEGLKFPPLWVKLTVDGDGVRRAVSKNGTSWTELEALPGGKDSIGLKMSAPGSVSCLAEIDHVSFGAAKSGLILLFR